MAGLPRQRMAWPLQAALSVNVFPTHLCCRCGSLHLVFSAPRTWHYVVTSVYICRRIGQRISERKQKTVRRKKLSYCSTAADVYSSRSRSSSFNFPGSLIFSFLSHSTCPPCLSSPLPHLSFPMIEWISLGLLPLENLQRECKWDGMHWTWLTQ